MIRVVLTKYEVAYACAAGCARRWLNINTRDPLGDAPDPWGIHIEGAAAELALARAKDRHWIAVADDFKALPGDVGRVQVRATKHAHGRLTLYPNDNDAAPFVLVTGAIPTFTIVGWLYAHEGKQPRYWTPDARVPCWWVPQSDLRPAFDTTHGAPTDEPPPPAPHDYDLDAR